MSCFRKFLPLLCLPGVALAQAGLTCSATAVPPLVSAEGLAERLGDIVLNCVNGTPNGVVTGNLTVILSTNITNRLNAQNHLDTILTTDNGTASPAPSNVPARLAGANQLVYEGLSFTLSGAGATTLRLTNLRGAVATGGITGFLAPVTARLAFNAGQLVSFASNTFTIGIPNISLLGSLLGTLRCSQTGSPLPDTMNFATLLQQGTSFVSARVTEGYAEAFQPRDPLADTGTRVISRYSGFPAGARLFVPDVIAGSNALQPTSAGDFGVPVSAGQYAPSPAGSLLLVRVRGTDANGAGGSVPATGSFGTVSEVDLNNGAGFAVYEVVDASRTVRESAQITTWLGLPSQAVSQTVVTRQEILLAPVSTVNTASSTAPIPRFAASGFPPDCQVLGDCNASYLPRLGVDAPPLEFTAVSGASFQLRYIRVFNDGGGLMTWNAGLTYKNGSGWLRIDPDAGTRNATIRLDVLPVNLAPGVYEASLAVDAGIAGARTVPVKLTVLARPADPAPNPAPARAAISAVTNAASFAGGPLVPGSLATIKGTRFAGGSLTVTFDTVPARVLFANDGQINLEVPAALGNRTSAQLVVSVDGLASDPQTVTLADFSPGIFVPGILNQDNSVNSVSNGGAVGSIAQMYATGVMPAGAAAAAIVVKIHDRFVNPLYAGSAPGIPGLQQVNFVIPEDLPAMVTEVRICSAGTSTQICSPAVNMTLK